MIDEQGPDLSYEARLFGLKEKIAQRNQTEAALIEVLSAPSGTQIDKVYTDAWLQFSLAKGDLDEDIQELVARKLNVKKTN